MRFIKLRDLHWLQLLGNLHNHSDFLSVLHTQRVSFECFPKCLGVGSVVLVALGAGPLPVHRMLKVQSNTKCDLLPHLALLVI